MKVISIFVHEFNSYNEAFEAIKEQEGKHHISDCRETSEEILKDNPKGLDMRLWSIENFDNNYQVYETLID